MAAIQTLEQEDCTRRPVTSAIGTRTILLQVRSSWAQPDLRVLAGYAQLSPIFLKCKQ